ncbi:hypothetical protein L6164_002915 [Bauhinia variegata]|uniref:Uncharacterized protein n=1 Tax=Bauhinia variegata TaxID=167791 RepID=A0ACB9PZT0_BAUVA|nr:hypothetical protein L6164_002915 [Bauhinia variegata]
MEIPQRAYYQRDWKSFKRFFQDDKRALIEPFDLGGNTAIKKVARNLQRLREYLEMLSPRDRWHALRKKNFHGSTILHIHNLNVEIADEVLKYEKELPQPPDNEIDKQQLEEKELPLLEIRNMHGETPIYRAAFFGNLKLLKYLAKQVTDMKMHFHRKKDKMSILHAAVIGQHLDVALWLLNLDNTLAFEKDDNGCTCLQLLSTMPSVFHSGTQFERITEKFIYYFLPKYNYDDDDGDDSTKVLVPTRDIETGEDNRKQHISGWSGIEHIQKTKKKSRLAKLLADFLVRKDDSWKNSFDYKENAVIISPAILSSNVSTFLKNTQCTKKTTRSHRDYTPLLLAAASGIDEIVEKILELYPEAIKHVSEDGLNILHVAVMYRQKKIYGIVKDGPSRLPTRLSATGNSLLHQVGSMEFYRGRRKAGIAYRLQEELRWFKRVQEIVPTFFLVHCNNENLTAQDLFNIEHNDMFNEARDWIKKTAESCSTVAILVATVVFAAAYNLPGGNDRKGLPVFIGSPVFLFFTITDVVALVSSMASVMMFLSILTSSLEIEDFYQTLPRNLSLGFGFLFFSLMTSMLAFTSTILLSIKLDKSKWTSTLIYIAVFFPVAMFGLLQYPLGMAVKDLLKVIWKHVKKLSDKPSSEVQEASIRPMPNRTLKRRT